MADWSKLKEIAEESAYATLLLVTVVAVAAVVTNVLPAIFGLL